MIRTKRVIMPMVFLVLLGACSSAPGRNAPDRVSPASLALQQTQPTQNGDESEIAALAAMIVQIGDAIDPQEAQTAAQIALLYPRGLRVSYGVTDGPLVHNMKVNAGLRPRGLCWHWAEDIQKRLLAENFKTLDIHRAIANADSWRLEHSTALIGPKGGTWNEAIIVDPWRYGGVLYWSKVPQDTRFDWRAQGDVLADKRHRKGNA